MFALSLTYAKKRANDESLAKLERTGRGNNEDDNASGSFSRRGRENESTRTLLSFLKDTTSLRSIGRSFVSTAKNDSQRNDDGINFRGRVIKNYLINRPYNKILRPVTSLYFYPRIHRRHAGNDGSIVSERPRLDEAKRSRVKAQRARINFE